MAIAITALTSSFTATDAASYTTASVTPSANVWLVVDVMTAKASPVGDPTISGLSLTWTKEGHQDTFQTNRRITRFYAWTGSSPGSGAITFDYGGVTHLGSAWHVYEISGANTTDPFVQTVGSDGGGASATSVSVTLSAFADSNNRPLISKLHVIQQAATQEGGYTEFGDVTGAGPAIGFAIAYHATATDTTPSYTWGTATGSYSALASEIAIAAAGGTNINAVTLSATPSLPAASLTHSLTAATLTATPTQPAATLRSDLTAATLTVTPSQPAARLDHRVLAALLTVTPSFPTASVQIADIRAVTLTITPTLPAASLSSTQNVTAVTLTATPSLPQARVDHNLSAATLTASPTLPTAALVSQITAALLQVSPSLPAATLVHSLSAATLTATPTLPAAALRNDILAVTLTITPSQPAASLVAGDVQAVTLIIAPTFPRAGVIKEVNGPIVHATDGRWMKWVNLRQIDQVRGE